MKYFIALLLTVTAGACVRGEHRSTAEITSETGDDVLDALPGSRPELPLIDISDLGSMVGSDSLVSDIIILDVEPLDVTARDAEPPSVDSSAADVSQDDGVAADAPSESTADLGAGALDVVLLDGQDLALADVHTPLEVGSLVDSLAADANGESEVLDPTDDGVGAAADAIPTDAIDDAVPPPDDANPETVDELDDADTTALADPGTPCDDGSLCTHGDAVQADGSCAGNPVACDDGEACTDDVCWPMMGCKHVWIPGCGNKPCGDCPEELGYTCVAGSESATCISADGSKVFIPPGVFMFGSKLRVLDDGELFFTPALWLFVRGFFIDRFQPSLKAVTDLLPAEGSCTPADIEGGCFYCDDMESGPVLVMGESSCACDVCSKLGGRLCSSIEWEKAAVGGCSRLGCSENDQACCSSATWPYAWGFEPPSCDVRVSCQCTFPAAPFCFDEGFLPWGVESGTLKEDRSPYGVFDMGGNGVEVIALTYFEFFGVLSTQCGWGEASYESEVFDASCISTYEPSAIGLYMAGEPSRMSRERTYIWDIQPGNVYPNGPRCCYDLPTAVPEGPVP